MSLEYCCKKDGICVSGKPVLPDVPKGKCAFVTMLIINDTYLPGIILAGIRLKAIVPEIDSVCMVTPDIPQEARDVISKVHIVIEVPYIEIPEYANVPIKESYYKTYTKLNIFKLIQYDKVVFYDADMIPIQKCKEIFLYPAPAAVILGYHRLWGKDLDIKMKEYNDNVCSVIENGQLVSDADYQKFNSANMSYRFGNFKLESTIMVLKPSIDEYNRLVGLFNKMIKNITTSIHKNYYSDTEFLSRTITNWHSLDIRYLGRWMNLETAKQCFFTDEFGDTKPWNIKEIIATKQEEAMMLWWTIYVNVMKKNVPLLKSHPKLGKLYLEIKEVFRQKRLSGQEH